MTNEQKIYDRNVFQEKLVRHCGIIDGIQTQRIELDAPFLDFASRFSDIPGTVLLMSGGDLDCSKHHILAVMPWLTFSARAERIRIQADGLDLRFRGDPFDVLRWLIDCYGFSDEQNSSPVRTGLFGYLSYDLKDRLEKLPGTSLDDLGLPHILLFAPRLIVVQEKETGKTWLHIPERTVSGKKMVDTDLKFFHRRMQLAKKTNGPYSSDFDGLNSCFTRSDYIESIQRIKEYIASGHVYQVNMSQRFEAGFSGDPFSFFKDLYDQNPAPFFAYVHAEDHDIVCTSPERFLLRRRNWVETRPIKGTRPRGDTPAEDERLAADLSESRKDDAELSMIVDLLRNDIGKVCGKGSVVVTQHKKAEAYTNVHHLVSIVEGTLDEGMDSVDLIRATFPGGSITGCPKIRSMEIIDELEPRRRHIYTGSIGYIGFQDTMDLNIAIRTATIYKGKIYFSVGGGIVYDSVPEDEFQETLDKGRTFLQTMKKTKTSFSVKKKQFVWLNGAFIPMENAFVPITIPGFQHGFGFFETIRAKNGKIGYLADHLDRFHATWKALFEDDPPDITWKEVIEHLTDMNGLSDQTAVVKIIAAMGDASESPFGKTLAVTAQPYTHRLEGKEEKGLHLATYPYPRQTPLADHKTLNYLFYRRAGEWAKKAGADEALILNPDGSVSECNTANILLIRGNSILHPNSRHVLPGIMAKKTSEFFERQGFISKTETLFPDDILEADLVFVTNSLMGLVPVLSIDGHTVKKSSSVTANEALVFY